MAVMEYSWGDPDSGDQKAAVRKTSISLNEDVIVRNARWFVKLRWYMLAVLAVFQLLALLLGGNLARTGIVLEGYWPAVIALILAVCNTVYMLTLPKKESGPSYPRAHIWFQTAIDLILLTFVVHYIGSLGTPAPFLYVLHIALAAIFLSTESSFIVLSMVWVLYGACVYLEYSGIFPPQSVFAGNMPTSGRDNITVIIFQSGLTDALFLVVWYLVSQLSQIIRIREKELLDAGIQTRKLHEEKDRYAVQMTHQLKAPLDAIRSNLNLMIDGYYGEIPEKPLELLRKTESRAVSLSRLILDVLDLSRLSTLEENTVLKKIDLSFVLKDCVEELLPYAKKHNVSIRADYEPLVRVCSVEQMKLLFDNLMTNAVAYSLEGGEVQVRVSSSGSAVYFEDHGIGIAADKLPYIFEEYFRTREAAEHNQSSSGIGLAIVKRVAMFHGITLKVESEKDKGTKVIVHFPSPAKDA